MIQHWEAPPPEATAYRMGRSHDGKPIVEPTADDMCICGHRYRFHEGRRASCSMAGCRPCQAFKAAEVKADE